VAAKRSMSLDTFRHDAFLYGDQDEFLEEMRAFVAEGVDAGEPALVAVPGEKAEQLRAALGPKAADVCFADMYRVGRNPGRIIPVWREFVRDRCAEGRPVRGVGEPVWAGRSSDELVECRHHESLLNLAFDGSPAWWLVCPYDVSALDPAVVDEARTTHPFVLERGARVASPDYGGTAQAEASIGEPLAEPPFPTEELAFQGPRVAAVRDFVARRADALRLEGDRAAILVLAAGEIAANSVRHGGGGGVVRVWAVGETVVCEVRDRGRIASPLVGRDRPSPDQESGRGLWIVHQLCDLVQVRSTPAGTTVRLHVARR
jgi:anti-sigma regulatory factor (Ser/Thr protein kinase)